VTVCLVGFWVLGGAVVIVVLQNSRSWSAGVHVTESCEDEVAAVGNAWLSSPVWVWVMVGVALVGVMLSSVMKTGRWLGFGWGTVLELGSYHRVWC